MKRSGKDFFRNGNDGIKSLLIILLVINVLNYSCSDENQIGPGDGSAYITDVFDYKYAPGQHASLIPKDWKGEDFKGKPWVNDKSFTSLGGWGGYIIAGFNHTVKNGSGNDFAIYTQPGPASEPAVVYVMEDKNNDRYPNDGDWIELRGSEYNNAETIHNYLVTYSKPVGNGNVTWHDNKGNQGELKPLFQSSTWWWQGYGEQDEVSFSGVKLPNAYLNNSATDVENWIVRQDLFSFGYAECYNNADYDSNMKADLFDISNAVDASGNPVSLSGIRFIKVQSGVFQIAGWLNEISTEISGAADLSMIN